MADALKAPSGRNIWKAMREELRLNLYELPYTALPPTLFHIYLSPADFDRIEGIVPRLVAQLQQALTDEVKKINEERRRSGQRVLSRIIERDAPSPVEAPSRGWEVYIHADRNGALKPGHLGIESTLALPPPAEYGGPPTTRIVKSVVTKSGRTSTTIDVEQPAAPSSRAPVEHDSGERASLTYEDAQGSHVFSMRKDTLSVGRGGSSAWVDLQVMTTSKVSREHVRLRRDEAGRFFIQDVSLWGTSVDGTPIPPAEKDTDGVVRPGAEQQLPSTARIELADALVLQFEAGRGK